MLFEGLKIVIAMEQFKIVRDTKRCNQAIDRFPDGNSTELKCVIISGCSDGETRSRDIENREGQESPLGEPETLFVADSLQDLTEDQVRQANCAEAKGIFEPGGLRVDDVVQIVDPD